MKIILENDDGNLKLEQIGSSMYVRFYNKGSNGSAGETRRYMDITPIFCPDKFNRNSERIMNIGRNVGSFMQKPHIESWEYNGISFTRELSPYWDPYPRHEIEINEFTFVYYPNGENVDVTGYWLDIWNFNVPGYRKDNVYVRKLYDGITDLMTDEELFNASEMQIQNIDKALQGSNYE